MEICEYCGHPITFHIYNKQTQKPSCNVELGYEYMEGYEYKPEFESKREKLCGCYKVREVISVR